MNYYFSAYFCGICETFPLARAGKTSMPLQHRAGKTSMPLQRPIPSDMEIAKPTVAQLVQLSLEEKKMTQKQLAMEIGVSPSRISDYISGRAEQTLKIARQLCAKLGIAPAAMLGC